MSGDQVEHVAGHADHGGQRQQQADEVAPPRIVVVQVRQRLEVHHVEDEHALWPETVINYLAVASTAFHRFDWPCRGMGKFKSN